MEAVATQDEGNLAREHGAGALPRRQFGNVGQHDNEDPTVGDQQVTYVAIFLDRE